MGFKPTLMTSLAITLPVSLFLGFNSKYMWDNVNESVPLITVVLFIITIIYLIIASFSDPGIILRYSGETEERKEIMLNQMGHDSEHDSRSAKRTRCLYRENDFFT